MNYSIGNPLYSKILIVEDDPAQLVTLVDIFTDAGFQPLPCTNAEELSRQLLQRDFAVAVVDLKLADMTGVEAINLIRQAKSEAKIIVYTAFGSYESAKEAVNLGAFAFVEKAGDVTELVGHAHRASHQLLLEELRESERTFRNFAENINAVFWMRTIEGRLVYVSPKCEQIWGIDALCLQENPSAIIDAICTEDKPRFLQALQELSSAAQPVNFDLEYRLQRPNGEIVWIRDRSFSIRDDQGTVVRHAGLAEDITLVRMNIERLRILERAIDSAKIGIVISNARQQNTITYCNPAFERLTGYAADELIGLNCRILQGKDREQAGVKELRRAVSEGRETNAVVRNYRKDGSFFWNEVSLSPIYDAQGTLTHFVGFQRDISARVEMEQKLRESEQRFRTIFEQAAVGVALIESQTGRFLRINGKYSALIGYRQDEMLNKTFMEVTAPGDLQEDLDYMEQLKAGEIAEFALEKRLICKDGSLMWVNLTVSPTWQPGEIPMSHIAIIEDITARKNLEQSLLKSERTLAKAQSIAKVGSWEFDLKSGQLSGSAEMLRLIGINDTDSIPRFGTFIQEFVDPRDRKLIERSFSDALESGALSPIEFRFLIPPDSELHYGRCEAEFVKDENGIPTTIIGTLQDITEQRIAAEESRRHLEELAHVGRLSTMGEMVAGIAHELNQPLYSIANFSEACTNSLRQDKNQTDRVLKWTAEISNQATRAGQIIQRLGEFVRKERPHRSTVDINKLIQESAELLSFETRHDQIQLHFVLQEPTPLVLADRIQLQQVIVNLLRNAYESMLTSHVTNRQVTVTTTQVDSSVTVRVEDSGPGIPTADIKKIFQPFYSTKRQGMGMGLAISKSILESHDSELTVRSNETGTVFEFKLALLASNDSHEK